MTSLDVTLPCIPSHRKAFIKEVAFCNSITCSGRTKQLFQYVLAGIMSKAQCLVFLVIVPVLLMLSLVVDAQPTVDEDESCEFDETARNVKLMNIARGVEEVKNLLGSRQQSCSALDSSSLCEYKTRFSYKCSDVEKTVAAL